MSVIGGLGGHIAKDGSALNCIRTWGIAHSAALQAAVCSASKGATIQVPGNTDWTGQFTGYGHIPPVIPGESFLFAGAITGVDAAAIGAGGTARVDQIVINWDIEAGTVINYSVGFSANGTLTIGTVTAPADSAVPAPQTSKGCVVKIAPGAAFNSFTAINDVRTATLTIGRANPAYVSSATSGQSKREKGALSASVSLSLYAQAADGWATFPQVNVPYAIQLFTDDSLFWLLKWVTFSELGGLDVDMETAAIVGCSPTAQHNAVQDVSDTPTIGEITDPDSSTIWPE